MCRILRPTNGKTLSMQLIVARLGNCLKSTQVPGSFPCSPSLHIATPKNLKRRPGRPRHTWLRTVEEDLRQFNLGLASGFRKAQKRTAWRTLTETATSPTSSDWWWLGVVWSMPHDAIVTNRVFVCGMTAEFVRYGYLNLNLILLTYLFTYLH